MVHVLFIRNFVAWLHAATEKAIIWPPCRSPSPTHVPGFVLYAAGPRKMFASKSGHGMLFLRLFRENGGSCAVYLLELGHLPG